MKRRAKRTAALFLALLCALLSAACGGSSEKPEGEKIITVGYTTAWGNFIPYYAAAETMYDLALYDKIYDKLAFTDKAGTEILPRNALRWESDDEGRSLIFHLNPDSRWSDGTPVTAQDWVFTTRLLADPFVTFTTRIFTPLLEGTDEAGVTLPGKAPGVEALDDYTLKLAFEKPVAPEDFLIRYNRKFLVLPEHLLGAADPEEILHEAYWDNPVGSGPCVYVSQIPGAEITFTPNPYYPNMTGNWDKLVLRVLDSASVPTALLSEDIDVRELGTGVTKDTETLLESGGLSVQKAPVRDLFMEILLNEANIPDVRIRQALHLAVDKEALLAADGGDGVPAYGYALPGSEYDDPSLAFSRDVERAKALLAEAGYDGHPFTFAFAAKRENLAALLVSQWAEAGIQVEMTVVDVVTMFAGVADGTYDLGISGHSATAYSLWFEDEFPADTNPAPDPVRADYTARISAAFDAEERAALVKEYQRYLQEKAWFIPLYFSGSPWVMSVRVENVRDSASVMCNDNVWEWVVK